ncbi:MAG TPA: hypothetical protein VJA18_04440 [Candidatus Nanoarchaeia archaeon]|nr:hypothetical protein [Candidatus Nanoarchaeia archaeon]
MGKGYHLDGDTIVINRELTKLDLFVKDFLDVLKKYADYLLVSGFVSISSGRTRGTEDVDILVPAMNQNAFEKLFEALQKSGFWCYQGDSVEEVYPYIEEMSNIRFARVNEMFPNMEVIPITEKRKAKFFEFTHPQKMKVQEFEFEIPPLEFEILYKELVLGGQKDLADAKHLRTFFAEIIKKEKFKEYEPIIKSEL